MNIELTPNLVIAERFRLNRPLGRGAMGSVWHATHLGLETACALKFIGGAYADHPEAQARFQLEAKAAAHLRSPHVVQILDHGVFQGMPYIAMELLEGEDLGQRLTRLGRLGAGEAVAIALQICRALTKAHTAGIVHRDLKPANVFLVPDDDRQIAKVLDFGIAKSSGAAADVSSTKTGAILGTPSYMSPEQAQGTRAIDHRSDLWSLAIIVHQCITGRLPFESEALGDLFLQIMVNPIPVPSHTFADLPKSFDAWWERATARDPERRFQSAKELGDSLSRVFEIGSSADLSTLESVRPSSRSLPATATSTSMRVPVAVGVAVAAVLASFAIGAMLVVNAKDARPAKAASTGAVVAAPPASPEHSPPPPASSAEQAPVNVITAVPTTPEDTASVPVKPSASASAPPPRRPAAPRTAPAGKPGSAERPVAAGASSAPSPKSSAPSRSGGGPKEFWSAIKNNLELK